MNGRVKNNRFLRFLWIFSAIMLPVVAAAQEPQFEVASIKPDDPKISSVGTNLDLDATDLFQYRGGAIVADGYVVNYLIFAYKITNAGQYNGLNAQLPKWAQYQKSQTFRLVARAGDHPTKDTLRSMVRSLLAERFGLKVHTETQQQLAWVLVKTAGGRNRSSQLRPHTGAPVCATVVAVLAPPVKTPTGNPPRMCGPLILHDEGGLNLIITDYTMPQIAGEMTLLGERQGGMDELPGIDGTQVPGKFDLDLHFVSSRGPGASSEQAAASGPDFLQALSTQARLEFKKNTVPVEVLVVDQVSEPTPD